MKLAIISGLKKKLLLVESDSQVSHMWRCIYDTHILIGKLTDIEEEKLSLLVDKFNNGAYRNYNDKNSFSPDADTNNILLTAKESFFSKLEADGIYFENKIQKPTVKKSTGTVDLSLRLSAYYESQEKVWDINRTYLFLIL